jgi:hypothetical protein
MIVVCGHGEAILPIFVDRAETILYLKSPSDLFQNSDLSRYDAVSRAWVMRRRNSRCIDWGKI